MSHSILTDSESRTRTDTSGRNVSRRSRRSNGRPVRAREGSRDLPAWRDLEPADNRRVVDGSKRASTGLAAWPTARMVLLLAVGAFMLTLYVGHVHATQALVSEVHQMRRENLQLHLRHNRLTGELDRLGGPMSVYERARDLGLEDGQQVGPPVTLDLE